MSESSSTAGNAVAVAGADDQAERAHPWGSGREGRRMRRWARTALIAHVVFTASWLLAASWQGPRYSVLGHSISDMYADGAPGAWFLILVITGSGLALLLFAGRSLRPALRGGGRLAGAGCLLLALSIFGLGDLLTPFEREGCRLAAPGCTSHEQTANAGGALDATLSTLGVVALIAACFVLAAAMKRTAKWRGWVSPMRRAGVAVAVLLVLDGVSGAVGLSGLAERLIALAGAALIVALCRGVLRLSAPARR